MTAQYMAASDEVRENIELAREHVRAAAQLLRGVSPDMERVSWLLEDSLSAIDEAEQSEDLIVPTVLETEPIQDEQRAQR